jgi:hypothetical protein
VATEIQEIRDALQRAIAVVDGDVARRGASTRGDGV